MQQQPHSQEAAAIVAERVAHAGVRRGLGVFSTLGRRSLAEDAAATDIRIWNALLGAPALSAIELQVLGAAVRMRTVAAGETIFGHEDAAATLVALRSGEAALGYRTADGVFHVERPVRAPGWLDLASSWLEERHAIDALATTESVVLELPREALQAQLAVHPQLAQRLIVSLAREVQRLSVNTHELMHKDAPARFAAWLLQRCAVTDDSGGRGVVRLGERKRDIASQLAITPETLSRLMRSLSRREIISVAGYTVQVLDVPALRAIAAGE
jgi:CRP-like cAMP-binding protein